jgi:16S rRNA (guanine527-N7)-methyltransferase
METSRIAELLQPFLADPGTGGDVLLRQSQLEDISIYIDILLRWNARINLTAVRHAEDIVTRHFGESLFAARHLFPGVERPSRRVRVFDVGSGAGFPGLPIKIWAPDIELTLIESNHKKAAFLREVVRSLKLTGVDVFAGRAEQFLSDSIKGSSQGLKEPKPPEANSPSKEKPRADVVTLRAVERFEAILPVAASLVGLGGRLGLLIGETQVNRARELAKQFNWKDPVAIPRSNARVLLLGESREEGGISSELR